MKKPTNEDSWEEEEGTDSRDGEAPPENDLQRKLR